MQVAGFMTEFGAVGDDPMGHELIDLQTSRADDQLQSWAYWTYKSFFDITTQNAATEAFFNSDGSLQEDKVNRLARAYARSIAGVPKVMQFDRTASTFRLEYFLNYGKSNMSTEIFLNRAVHFKNGFNVTLSPDIAQYTIIGDFVIVTHNRTVAGQSLTVTISQ